MKKKLVKKVFVSSTVYDLECERKAVHDFLKDSSNEYVEFQPVMSDHPETFLFFDETDFSLKHSYDVCLEKIKECDYFILLINKRYNPPKGGGESITNLEYKEAKRLLLPCLIFVNKNTDDARNAYKKGLEQNWVDPKQIKIFDFISEINQSERANWKFNYLTSEDIIKQLKCTLLNFDHSSFVSENPPDNITKRRNDRFIKEWTIVNDGNILWKNRKMKCITVERGGLVPQERVFEIPDVYPGEEYTLRVEYQAVTEGDYESVWRMFNEEGKLCFKDENIKGLWITVRIEKR